jgi:hypothetical protein
MGSRGVARIGWALTVVLLLGSVASAGPKEDVSAVKSEWGRALGGDDPDKVVVRLPLFHKLNQHERLWQSESLSSPTRVSEIP